MTSTITTSTLSIKEVKDVNAEVYFMARDEKFQHERPYTIRYDVGNGFPQTNIDVKQLPITVRNVRPYLANIDMEVCGFQIMKSSSALSYHDFDDNAKIVSTHIPTISQNLLEFLDASSVRVFDFNIRRRDNKWPVSTGQVYKNNQPALRAHIDMTYDSASELIKGTWPDEAESILQGGWQVINIWHVLRGPSVDWPLAICDASTVNFELDTMVGDIVDRDGSTENTQVHTDPHHQWYYVPDHQPNEALIFKNADSRSMGGMSSPGSPHTSFANPHWCEGQFLRESIEMRALVTYDSPAHIRDPRSVEGFHTRLDLLRERWSFKVYELVHHRDHWAAKSLIIVHVRNLKEAVVDDAAMTPGKWRDVALQNIAFGELLKDTGWYLFERGLVVEAKGYFEVAKGIMDHAPKPHSPQVADLLRDVHNCMGTALAELNDPANCLANQKAWLDLTMLRRAKDGSALVDYELAQAYNEIGVAYACNEMWIRAIECFEQSMDIASQQSTFEAFHLGWSAPNLGFMYWIRGELDAAEEIFEHIIATYAEKFGYDDTQSFKTGKMLHGMGNVQWSRGNFEKSLDFHHRALKQYCATAGSTHHRTAAVQVRLAEHYARMEEPSKALQYINSALRTFNDLGPAYNNEWARAAYRKSSILKDYHGHDHESRDWLNKANEMYERIRGRSKHAADKKCLTMADFDSLVAFWSR